MKRADFLATARGYLGTPFQHQARLPGIGLDCAGVVVCAATAHGCNVTDLAGYADIPSGGQFLAAVEDCCDRIQLDDVLAGDLMIFRWASEPQHIAIVSAIDPVWLLHSWSAAGAVVEHEIDAIWRRRLRGCYRLRGIA